MIDTAFNYENEGSVGRGVAASDVDRSEIIVTTKLPGRHHSSPKARTSIEESRLRLGLEATDLHLIHWPNPGQDEYVQAWAALVDAQARGVVRQIGVSNFLPEHLERIERETGVRPVVNQIEVHPYFPQEEQLAYHREHGILTEAWSPLGRAKELLDEAVIHEVAAAHGVTPAQTVLAWHVARGTVSIPKASSRSIRSRTSRRPRSCSAMPRWQRSPHSGAPDGRLFDADPRDPRGVLTRVWSDVLRPQHPQELEFARCLAARRRREHDQRLGLVLGEQRLTVDLDLAELGVHHHLVLLETGGSPRACPTARRTPDSAQ